jgi:UDP-N-acetylmuramoyl-tripeptide--D-alanyl-D-alanine ligase
MKNTASELYKLFTGFPKVSTDTRKEIKDSIFFALKGENFNGNEFAETAIKNGAAYAIIDDEEIKINNKYILVDDVLKTLQELAKYHREYFSISVIGITGSNGKTTTKELINAVLSKKYNIIATSGNLNNHIGVPLTILSITKKTEIAVVEIGANHIGEISELCKIAKPNFGIITNIGKAHLEGFGSIERIIKAKTELYNYIRSVNGKLFVNIDNLLLNQLSDKIHRVTYGTASNAECLIKLLEANPFVQLEWNTADKQYIINSKLIGSYNFENIQAAICIGNYFKVEPGKIIDAIENYEPENNRSQIIESLNNKIILDAYNANPDSMKVSINNFAEMPFKNKILIIGDMLELGNQSVEEHQNVLNIIGNHNYSKVLLIGEEFSSVNSNKNWNTFKTTKEAFEWLKNNPVENASILIKASRLMKLEQLVEVL